MLEDDVASFLEKDAGIFSQIALGAATPLGAYLAYRLIDNLIRQSKKREKEELLEEIEYELAERSLPHLEKEGSFAAITDLLKKYPYFFGLLAGVSGLSAYHLASQIAKGMQKSEEEEKGPLHYYLDRPPR